jgi:hypothetical protein
VLFSGVSQLSWSPSQSKNSPVQAETRHTPVAHVAAALAIEQPWPQPPQLVSVFGGRLAAIAVAVLAVGEQIVARGELAATLAANARRVVEDVGADGSACAAIDVAVEGRLTTRLRVVVAVTPLGFAGDLAAAGPAACHGDVSERAGVAHLTANAAVLGARQRLAAIERVFVAVGKADLAARRLAHAGAARALGLRAWKRAALIASAAVGERVQGLFAAVLGLAVAVLEAGVAVRDAAHARGAAG